MKEFRAFADGYTDNSSIVQAAVRPQWQQQQRQQTRVVTVATACRCLQSWCGACCAALTAAMQQLQQLRASSWSLPTGCPHHPGLQGMTHLRVAHAPMLTGAAKT